MSNRRRGTSSRSRFLTVADFGYTLGKQVEVVNYPEQTVVARGERSAVQINNGEYRVLLLDEDWRTGLSCWSLVGGLGLLTNDGRPTVPSRRCRTRR